jgi:TRAP-type C4-dicarboxylate transport system substrate-binding protein
VVRLKTSLLTAAALATATAAMLTPAAAADITLKAISFDRHISTYTKPLLDMAAAINKAKVGVKIEVVPDGTMSPFAMGNAVKTGVVDIGNIPFTFYQNLLPIGDAMKLATVSTDVMRKNGTFALLDKLHAQKVNAKVLTIYGDGVKFYLYLRDKKLTTANLTGLKLRVTPIYRAAFRAMGASVVQMPPSDVYTALERGVVDGYGWTILDVKSLGWAKYTKYRVEPGFFQAFSNIMINLNSWAKLNAKQKKVVMNAAVAAGRAFNARVPRLVAKGKKEQAALGMKVTRLRGAARKKFLTTAYAASWKEAEKLDPVNAKKLHALITK